MFDLFFLIYGFIDDFFIEFVVGSITGFILASYSRISKYYSNKKIYNEYPIANYYLSRYYDEIDGKEVHCTAPAIFKRKGKKIIAETWYTHTNEKNGKQDLRKWILDGVISEQGYFFGGYYAENPYDPGIGTFFLKINPDTSLSGFWTGYDSLNEKITQGSYLFHPCIENLNIINYDTKYKKEIIELTDKQLGKNYLNDKTFEIKVDNQTNFFKLAIINPKPTSLKGRYFKTHDSCGFLVGYLKYYLCKKDCILENTFLSPLMKFKSFKYAIKIGVIKTIAVAQEYQGVGIGTELFYIAIQDLTFSDVDLIIAIAWKSKTGINIERILQKFNFIRAFSVPNFWEKDSIEEGFYCPVCGEPPCSCEAVVYYYVPSKKFNIINLYSS